MLLLNFFTAVPCTKNRWGRVPTDDTHIIIDFLLEVEIHTNTPSPAVVVVGVATAKTE